MALPFQKGTALHASFDPVPTPTVDRLAEPTLPAMPSQADLGAKEFWFQCLPCHGDKGQGLTDEFRQTYPPEDRNCWESGCHGKRPYENGWTIPDVVPAVIGPGTLQKFPTAGALQAFIKLRMPYQWPGTLDDETAWMLTAFILRENDLWPGDVVLDASNADAVPVAYQPLESTATPTPFPAPTSMPDANIPVSGESQIRIWFIIGLSAALVSLVVFYRYRQRAQ